MSRRPLVPVAIAALALLLSACGGAKDTGEATPAARPGALPFVNTSAGTSSAATDWRPVFADDFDGRRLDRGKWRTRVQPPTAQRRCSTPGPGMVRVRDGAAVLRVKKVRKRTRACPHGIYKNAMIGTGEVTEPGFSTTYGLFAARVKFQHGRGQHGAFWLQGTGADSAEIDAVEYFGDGKSDGGTSNLVHQTKADGKLVSVGGRRPEVPATLGAGNTPSSGWHVWSVEWSPSGYVFRLDGTVTMRTDRNKSSASQFMVLSLLTSDWELPSLDTTASPMKVDWVRVWKH